ncbi:MAG: carboxypeptidase regulatory-like domain-containing protein [Acidobacteria bacterium]|nr:MAG: carboxypeptidase regulatory-like domain-containing protein [Acidobacteriota bacterium]
MKFLSILATLMLLFTSSFAQGTGTLKGKVRTSEGKALSDVLITAKKDDKEIKSTKTNSKGEFLMTLDEGKYNLVFTKKGYSLGILYNVAVVKNKTTDLGDRLILNIDQGTLVIIKGSVFNSDGLSIPEAKVEIERILSDGTTKKLDSTYTNISGEFTFKFPEEPARFRVTATKDGISSSKEISVDMAAVYRLSIKLNVSKK